MIRMENTSGVLKGQLPLFNAMGWSANHCKAEVRQMQGRCKAKGTVGGEQQKALHRTSRSRL